MKYQKNHRLSMKDLEKIAYSQNELELRRSSTQTNYAFCDTNTITTLAYSIYYFNKYSKKLLKIVEKSLYKYKNVFLCNDDFPFADTWDRSGIGSREKLQEINIELLQKYHIEYSLLSGTVENRLQQIRGVINV
jgi:nicotinamide riboside kinase